MTKISRRKLAAFAADKIAAGNGEEAMRELAAYLIDSRRTHEEELLVRDIEAALLSRGTAVVTTTSARKLSTEAKASVRDFVSASYDVKTVALREIIDESVIGGVKIETPTAQLNDTVLAKLEKLTVK